MFVVIIAVVLLLWLLGSRTPLIVALSATGTDALPNSVSGIVLQQVTLIDSTGDEVRIGREFTLSRENAFTIHDEFSVPARDYTALEMEFMLEGESQGLRRGIPDDVVLNAPIALTTNEKDVSALLLVVDINRSIVRRETGMVFLPVMRIETREGVTLGEGGTTVEGGTIHTNATFGTTEDGVLKQNYVAR